MKLIHVKSGDPILARLVEEPLASQWWADAESRHEDGTSYVMVVDDADPAAPVPAAWAGYRIESVGDAAVLRCCNNYVARSYRGHDPDWYAVAYAERHRTVVEPSRMPAVTFLYAQPIPLHVADGWVIDTAPGSTGVSRTTPDGEEHWWWRLRRPAGV